MFRTASLLAGLAIALFVMGSHPSLAAKRVALVVGNDAYIQVPGLQKAVNDAHAIGDTLELVGYRVIVAENVTRREMNRQLQHFASQLEPGDEALFFYAGHGVEIAGRNYLLPIDIPNVEPGQEDFVTTEAIPVDIVLDRIRSRGTRVSVLILDACRDNPFPKSGTRSLGATRGLAGTAAPEGTFIMYSAGVGQTALDRLNDADPNPNSVFTRSLIPLLKTPGMSLTRTAREVRRDVQKLAATVSHEQRPAYYDEVTGDFFFAGEGENSASAIPTAKPDPALQAWNAIQTTDSQAILNTFISRFPKSIYADFARARLKEMKSREVASVSPPAVEKPATTSRSPVVARVGGRDISERELAVAETDLAGNFSTIPEEKRKAAALNALIDIRNLAMKAEQAGMDDAGDFRAEMTALEKKLSNDGLEGEELNVRMSFLRNRALHNRYFQTKIANILTEAKVRERYNAEVAKQGTRTEIRARHILVKTRDEAVSLIEKLKAGQDFGELAIKYSTDPAGKNGGDLGYFGKGMMVPEFEKAAFALQAGEFTRQPIETQFGWHLILKEDERNAAPPDFDRVKDKVRQVILREEYDKLVQASRESDSVEILDKKLEADLLTAGALTSR